MGQDAADALDLREAQVLTDPDGQRVEPPQDQPGGHRGGSAVCCVSSCAAQAASGRSPSSQSSLSHQLGGGTETAQVLQQGWAQPALLRDRATKPSLEQALPIQQDLNGESLVSAEQSRASRTLQSADDVCWVPTPSWQHLQGCHLSAGPAQLHDMGSPSWAGGWAQHGAVSAGG